MVKRSVWKIAAVTLVIGAGLQLGSARAQVQNNNGSSSDNIAGQSEQNANLSPAEQVEQARNTISTMETNKRKVTGLLDTARRDQDIVRISCLDDKLNQLNVTIRSAQDHQSLLATAVDTNSTSQRNHEYGLILLYGQRASGLEGEARRCVGEDVSPFGNNLSITVQNNNNVVGGGNTDYPGGIVGGGILPGPMSPVR